MIVGSLLEGVSGLNGFGLVSVLTWALCWGAGAPAKFMFLRSIKSVISASVYRLMFSTSIATAEANASLSACP
jgi:hypothetical protein